MAAEIRTERKFFKVYYDFLYNEVLSGEEKFLFSTLKSFLDFTTDKNGTKGEAFPTLQTLCQITNWGKQKVINVIKSLVEKKVVKKIRRGLNKPNLYIIEDCEEMWTAKSPEAVKEVETDDNEKPMTAEDYIAELKKIGCELKKLGYEVEVKKTEPASASNATTMPESRKTEPAFASNTTTMPENRVTKEKEPVSDNDQITDTSTRINNLHNDTTGEPKSQEGCFMSKANADEPKSQEQDSTSEADADALLNRLWKLYPVKKGKGRISAAQKKKLLKIGYDEMARAIERYKQYVESVDFLHYQYGSTFFTGGYVDYLDANYDPESDLKAKSNPETKNKQKKNRFNDYPTREYDFDEIKRTMFLQ